MQLRLTWAQSLKDKRKVIKSIKEKIRNKYNISVIESGFKDKWNSGLISIAQIGESKPVINNHFNAIQEYILSNFSIQLTDAQKEFY